MELEEDCGIECGKVFVNIRGNITFLCTLCKSKFKGYQEYSEHVNIRHYPVSQLEELNSKEIYSPRSFIPDSNEESSIPSSDGMNEKEMITGDVEKKCEQVESIFLPLPESHFKYKCRECEYSSSRKYKLMEHMRRHYHLRPYKCPECVRSFHTPNDLKRHRLVHVHKNRIRSKPTCMTDASSAQCGVSTSFKVNSISNEDEEILTQRLPEKPILVTRTEDDKYKCGKCGYVCKDKSNIWGHIKRHSQIKPYQCEFCSKAFHTSTELNSHTRTHTGEKPYLCTECGRAFITSSKLNVHVKNHSKVRDKACSICNMKFSNSTSLRNHMAVHSDDRPHICDVCKACFKRRKALINHLKLHDNKREYVCQLCAAAFNQKPGLISHMKSKHSIIKNTSTELIEPENSLMH